MLRVYACLTEQHTAWSVIAAALVCAIASGTVVALLLHSRSSAKAAARVWRALAATAFGGGIWATHFIAILGYDPGLPIGFDIPATAMSALLPILAAFAAFGFRTTATWPRALCAGAALGGGAIGMHYLGMSALLVPGSVQTAGGYVTASVLLCIAASTAAMKLLHAGKWGPVLSAGMLTLATVLLHFTGMAGISIRLDPAIGIPALALGRASLALSIGAAAALLTGALLVAALIDVRVTASEGKRLRQLADAAFEGIATCEGMMITDANAALVAMLNCTSAAMRGMKLQYLFPADIEASLPNLLILAETSPVNTVLAGSAEGIAVELRVRRLVGRGRSGFVVAMRDLRERNAAEARILYLAHHDPLTGLANRARLRDRLEQELAVGRRTGKSLAVCCLDLDRFKTINDTFGHAAGDVLLREISRRLLAETRETDAVARLGGDEFVVVQTGLDFPEAAQHLAKRLVESLAGPIEIVPGHLATVTVSIGIAIYPEDGTAVDSLLVSADLALYRAKEEGRNTFAFFRADMDAAEQERRALEQDLRSALDRQEFSLAFQPQTDLRTGTITGFEALLRWRHPSRGQVSPALFIPVAEASGGIIAIGAWVLRQACTEAASWPAKLRIAVNVSAAQLQQTGFAAFVADVLRETGLEPKRLELEITETFVIRDKDGAFDTLRRIRGLGVLLALDDFGTGYSSLSMLRAFRFDRIKLDRSFVTDVATSDEACSFVAALVYLAAGLSLPILAEGVEDKDQLSALQDAGCAEAQGYLIGRPLPIGAYAHVTGRTTVARPETRALLAS